MNCPSHCHTLESHHPTFHLVKCQLVVGYELVQCTLYKETTVEFSSLKMQCVHWNAIQHNCTDVVVTSSSVVKLRVRLHSGLCYFYE